jgi:hypothetical protein
VQADYGGVGAGGGQQKQARAKSFARGKNLIAAGGKRGRISGIFFGKFWKFNLFYLLYM